MKVYVNDEVVELFEGAKVIDALRSFASKMGIQLPDNIPTVRDRYGNEIELDGRLTEEMQLKF